MAMGCGLLGLRLPSGTLKLLDDDCYCVAEPSALQALCGQQRDLTPSAQALLGAQVYLQVSYRTTPPCCFKQFVGDGVFVYAVHAYRLCTAVQRAFSCLMDGLATQDKAHGFHEGQRRRGISCA